MTLSISSVARLSSGHTIPLLGFGVYQNYSARESCLEAFAAGYRHIDSAQAYRNEEAVGQAVKESGLNREEIFITTKCVSKTHGYESTLQGVAQSLEKLGTGAWKDTAVPSYNFVEAITPHFSDYIDLFLIHDPFSGREKRLETYKALLECKDQNKIRSVGVSNFNVLHLEELREANYETPAVNQIELHPFCQQKPIVEYCKANGILVQAYCPLIRGKLDHPVFLALAEKHSRDPSQIVLRWSLQKEFVPLPKSSTPARIKSNAALYDFELSSEDMAAIDALDAGKEGSISWNPVDAP